MCQLEDVKLLLILFYMSAATRCLRKIEDISEADGEENKSVWWAAAEDDGAFSAALSQHKILLLLCAAIYLQLQEYLLST